MTTVLIVDDDEILRASLSRDLVQQGYVVHVAESAGAAMSILDHTAVDVLVTDLRMNGRDGIDLLGTTRDKSARTRSILMSAYASARDHQIANELGAVRVLCKPFTPRELLDAIHQAEECETGFRGSFHGLSLVDLLQMFHFGRRSISVNIAGNPPARVHMQEGEIVHAERGTTTGEEALRMVLSASSGAIHTSVLAPVPQTIERGFQELILDALRVLDEETVARTADAVAAPEQRTTEDPFARIRAAADRVGDATILGIDIESGEVVVVRGGFDPNGCANAVRSITRDVARLAPEWKRLEVVAGDVAFVVDALPGGRWLIVYCDALWGRYAAMRFRADAQRVLGST